MGVVGLALALCGALGAGGCKGLRPGRGRGAQMEVQGHRGCRGLRPENTMAAFRHAAALGVDLLELDLGLSRDGVLMVTHDPVLRPERCMGAAQLPNRVVKQLSAAQLLQLDCGVLADPDFPEQQAVPGQPMPRLEQVLDLLAQHSRLGANIEIKTDPAHPELTHPPERFARALVPLLRRRRLVQRVVVQSFDPAALQAVARLGEGRLRLSALVDRPEALEPMLRQTGARIVSPRHSWLEREQVRALQARGLRVIPWTVNRPRRMEQLIQWGVDGIITDYPDRLLRLLGR